MQGAIESFTVGYGLDGGGHEFESCKVAGNKFLYLDSGLDYLPTGQNQCDFVVIRPHRQWTPPKFLWQRHQEQYCDALFTRLYEWRVSVWQLSASGEVYDSERDCHCHGRTREGAWEFTGNWLDKPWPDCPRCEGTGYVESPAFGYGAYEALDMDDYRRHPLAWLAFMTEGLELA